MEKMMEEILEKTQEDRRKNVMLLVEVAVEVLKRCPYLSKTPIEEQRELLHILKEKELI